MAAIAELSLSWPGERSGTVDPVESYAEIFRIGSRRRTVRTPSRAAWKGSVKATSRSMNVGGTSYARSMATASGTFEVSLEPALHDQAGIGRMTLTKTWRGDLSGHGVGTMLTAGDPAAGRAGYVALETVEGELAGHRGSFAFQQFGTMRAPDQELRYEIVPGSGTGDLAGIGGVLALEIVGGEHRYTLTYTLD
jgi:hypothetical protein